jgi:hypothetical protein
LQLWEYDEAIADEPFTEVTWYGANTFCEAQDLSLPSETDVNLASPVLEWLIDNRIAGRGSIEIAAKTFASDDLAFRCVEQ